ncbi:hypothetical protein HNR21_001206 [Actinomadura cellulosilytica]|uniref:Uncharacterized protein n=1 Tax=Thermomonospora cellulosilytica TaxID=1411118 RepID=A0A7W3R7B4_9ACTN|nr:hypothetical protein [Thermomonospora cellulosilytica]
MRTLVEEAEPVARFDGMTTGLGQAVPLRVLWHAGRRRWLVHLTYDGGLAEAGALREFAEAVVRIVESREGVHETLLVDDGYGSIEVGMEAVDGAVELSAFLYYDTRQDFVGVSALGEPLFHNFLGSAYLQLDGTVTDEERLVANARALLDRLASTPDAEPVPSPPRYEDVVELVDPDRGHQRLVLSRRVNDGAWRIGVLPTMTTEIDVSGARALADALVTPGLEATVIENDRYRLTVAVEDGTVLCRFTSPGEGRVLEERVRGLDAEVIARNARTLRDALAG